MKDIQHSLSEAVSLLPVEIQQQTREAVKEGRITPQLLAALVAKLEVACSESKAKPVENPLVAKVDSLIVAIRTIEQRLKDFCVTRESRGEDKNGKVLADRLEGLRRDMRGLEDGLASLEPYQHWKVLVLMGLALAVGGLVGWYGHAGYTCAVASRQYTEVSRD